MAWVPEFADDFNRANGNIGNGWTGEGVNTAFQIASNKLAAQNDDFTGNFVRAPVSAVLDCKAEMTVRQAGGLTGHMLWVSGSASQRTGNGVFVAGGTFASLKLNNGASAGGWATALGTITSDLTNGDSLKFRLCVVDGKLVAAMFRVGSPDLLVGGAAEITAGAAASGVAAISPYQGDTIDDFAFYSRTLTNEVHFVFEGDSQTDSRLYPSLTSICLNEDVTMSNIASSGQRISHMRGQIPTQAVSAMSGTARANIYSLYAGVNDFALGIGSETPTTVYEQYRDTCLEAIAAGFDGVIAWTLPDCNLPSEAEFDLWSAEYNALIVANYATWSPGKVWLNRLDNVAELSDASNTTYFNGDDIHISTAGNVVIARGLIETANTVLAAFPAGSDSQWSDYINNVYAEGVWADGVWSDGV